jgi:hypothetical protein
LKTSTRLIVRCASKIFRLQNRAAAKYPVN